MSIQNAWDSYWKNTKPGDTQSIGGGTIKRQDDGTALFQDTRGYQRAINQNMTLDQVANLNPDIAKQWQKDFGYTRTPDGTWFNQMGNGFEGAIVTKNQAYRDVDLTGAKTPQDAFHRIANAKYGGILSLQDISDINDEVGGVGYYRDLGNGKYGLDPAYQQPAGTGLLGSAESGVMKPGQVPDGSGVQNGQTKPMLVPPGTPQPPSGSPQVPTGPNQYQGGAIDLGNTAAPQQPQAPQPTTGQQTYIGQTKPLLVGPGGQPTQPGPGAPAGSGVTPSPSPGTAPAPSPGSPAAPGGVEIGVNKPLPVNGQDAQTSAPQGGPSTNRQVDAGTETIEGRVQNLLATDANGNYTNPVVQQAVNVTMQQFAGRGLLNSSMAGEAAYQAAVSKAIEIAGPDAQTYFAQGRANQDAANVFERDARGYAQENARLDKQISVDMEKFNADLQYRYNALRLDKESQTEARALAQKYAIEMENIKSVNAAYDLYLRRISDIDNNPDYTAEVKIQMKNNAGKDFDLYAKAKGISQGMNLADRFTMAATPPSGSTPPPGGTTPTPNGSSDPAWRDPNTDRGGA